VQRLKGQLLRLKKEPEVLQEYDRVIKEQLELGIIEPVVELERADKIHYLPHAVVRKDAKTTKVRVVYDASSKEIKKGVSLNDCLHVGPPLSPLLYHIMRIAN
jgi:predicted nucleic acid-binding protein